MTASTVWHLAQVIIVAHAFFAAVTWTSLPSRIPIHFKFGGQVDAWTQPSLLLWFLLVLASIFVYLLVYILSRPGAQDLWNIPEKAAFLKLPREKRHAVVELVQIYGGSTSIAVGLLFLILHIGIYLTATAQSSGLPGVIQGVVYLIPALLLLGLIPWSRAIKRAVVLANSDRLAN